MIVTKNNLTMYLVLTGNEYGVDILNNTDLKFISIEDAETRFQEYVEEYGCAAMFKVEEDGLKLIKDECNF